MVIADANLLEDRDTYRFGSDERLTLIPGTIGWSARDFKNPEIRSLWEAGRYEIIDGVLAQMPPAYFRGGKVVYNLQKILDDYFTARQIPFEFSTEVDIAVSESRVLRADGVVVCGDDLRKYQALKFDPPESTWEDHPLELPPTIVIESVSRGHELHDRVTKRKWYAEFGAPNFWIVDVFDKSLECLTLRDGQYIIDAAGKGTDVIHSAAFDGLVIELPKVWKR